MHLMLLKIQNMMMSMVYNFFDKKSSGDSIKSEIISTQHLLYLATRQIEKLHTIISKFEKRKVYTSFKDNIWGADLAGMQLIRKYSKFVFLLYVIDIYSKYPCALSLKDNKGVAIANTFQKVLNESGCKSNKIWVNKGSKFYHRSKKSCLQGNDREMYLTHNEVKSVIAERFTKTIKNKIYK